MSLRIATNGCFDLLHPGHRYLLDYCAKLAGSQGQLLILLDTDESITELKGKGRPVQTQKERRDSVVDWYENYYLSSDCTLEKFCIKFFDNDYELLKAFQEFKPHIIVKGSDRPDVRTIVGSGEFPVLIVPRLYDEDGLVYSTTRLIEGDG